MRPTSANDVPSLELFRNALENMLDQRHELYRLSEIQFLRWEYVKDDCIELPDAKTGGRVEPLGPEARAVLADLPREDGNPWVIR